jgi:hypothetical protein
MRWNSRTNALHAEVLCTGIYSMQVMNTAITDILVIMEMVKGVPLKDISSVLIHGVIRISVVRVMSMVTMVYG